MLRDWFAAWQPHAQGGARLHGFGPTDAVGARRNGYFAGWAGAVNGWGFNL